jgi:DNA-directed RNA polymerase subunit beta
MSRLDDSGIVYIGAEVEAGDVLVGKVTPKGETQLTPEEKLLRAIFGEKASDVKDTSLRVPSGMSARSSTCRCSPAKASSVTSARSRSSTTMLRSFKTDLADQMRIVERDAFARMRRLMSGRRSMAVRRSSPRAAKSPKPIWIRSSRTTGSTSVWPTRSRRPTRAIAKAWKSARTSSSMFEDQEEEAHPGRRVAAGRAEDGQGHLAVKRRLQPGDKMAGRHGNKGVVSRIVPVEDMPYMADGTPVDIALNPLGVPSRMNIGQILETHLGRAAKGLGQRSTRCCGASQAV